MNSAGFPDSAKRTSAVFSPGRVEAVRWKDYPRAVHAHLHPQKIPDPGDFIFFFSCCPLTLEESIILLKDIFKVTCILDAEMRGYLQMCCWDQVADIFMWGSGSSHRAGRGGSGDRHTEQRHPSQDLWNISLACPTAFSSGCTVGIVVFQCQEKRWVGETWPFNARHPVQLMHGWIFLPDLAGLPLCSRQH